MRLRHRLVTLILSFLCGALAVVVVLQGALPRVSKAACVDDPCEEPPCCNGDCNGDSLIDIADAIYLLTHLFVGGPEPVPIASAQGDGLTAEERALLKEILAHVSVVELSDGQGDDGLTTIRFTGVNVQIVNGLGATNGNPGVSPRDVSETETNGVGNLIVGYQELRSGENDRTGSHNVVVGALHDYTGVGGMVAGMQNTQSGVYASVTGGSDNTASGNYASVNGGGSNTASGNYATVSGGGSNQATGGTATVSGGCNGTAAGMCEHKP